MSWERYLALAVRRRVLMHDELVAMLEEAKPERQPGEAGDDEGGAIPPRRVR